LRLGFGEGMKPEENKTWISRLKFLDSKPSTVFHKYYDYVADRARA